MSDEEPEEAERPNRVTPQPAAAPAYPTQPPSQNQQLGQHVAPPAYYGYPPPQQGQQQQPKSYYTHLQQPQQPYYQQLQQQQQTQQQASIRGMTKARKLGSVQAAPYHGHPGVNAQYSSTYAPQYAQYQHQQQQPQVPSNGSLANDRSFKLGINADKSPDELTAMVKNWVSTCLRPSSGLDKQTKERVQEIVRRTMPAKNEWANVDWANKPLPQEVLWLTQGAEAQQQQQPQPPPRPQQEQPRQPPSPQQHQPAPPPYAYSHHQQTPPPYPTAYTQQYGKGKGKGHPPPPQVQPQQPPSGQVPSKGSTKRAQGFAPVVLSAEQQRYHEYQKDKAAREREREKEKQREKRRRKRRLASSSDSSGSSRSSSSSRPRRRDRRRKRGRQRTASSGSTASYRPPMGAQPPPPPPPPPPPSERQWQATFNYSPGCKPQGSPSLSMQGQQKVFTLPASKQQKPRQKKQGEAKEVRKGILDEDIAEPPPGDDTNRKIQRLSRFEKPSNKSAARAVAVSSPPPKVWALRPSTSATSSSLFAPEASVFEEDKHEPIVGVSQELEKVFTRSAAGLEHDPKTVRPLHVLEQALPYILGQMPRKPDPKVYCYEQLKSIRQDLTVQHIFNAFTTRVYETHARICLEHKDLGEFNACQAKLRAFYRRPEMVVSRANLLEFTAYRLMYCCLTKSHADLAAELIEMPHEYTQTPEVKHALSIIPALNPLNVGLLDRCYKDAPNMGKLLIDLFLPPPRGLRMQMYSQLCKAYKPSLPLSYLKRCLLFTEPDGEGLPVDPKHPDPSTFEGFLAYVKAVRSKEAEPSLDSSKSTAAYQEVIAFLDQRKDFHEPTSSVSPSPPPQF